MAFSCVGDIATLLSRSIPVAGDVVGGLEEPDGVVPTEVVLAHQPVRHRRPVWQLLRFEGDHVAAPGEADLLQEPVIAPQVAPDHQRVDHLPQFGGGVAQVAGPGKGEHPVDLLPDLVPVLAEPGALVLRLPPDHLTALAEPRGGLLRDRRPWADPVPLDPLDPGHPSSHSTPSASSSTAVVSAASRAA